MTIKPISNKKMYYSIIVSIIDMIKEGTLQYGQKLYREDELVAMLQVSRPTFREALRVLEFLG
ncbi:MAG: FadR family transcriptional regulator, partial [Bacteroidetes bacterium]|nr:FadR family transcriptional regulator [Bacteroidota bacterium]